MKKPPHIYVIGAGLIGLSTADALVARGAVVTVLEKRIGPGQGASFANSGMIHPSQAWPWLKGDYLHAAQHVLALAQRSENLLGKRMKLLGLQDAQRPKGCVQLFDSILVGEGVRAVHDMLGDRCKLIAGEPDTFGRYALLFPDDASGNAHAYCEALERDLVKRGVGFKYKVFEDDVSRALASGDTVICAAGLGSVALCESLNVELPLYPECGFALNFKRPNIDLPHVPIMHHGTRSALTVFDDHVRLSGTVGEADAEALIHIWEEIAPDILSALGQPTMIWQEDRPMSKLGRPIISHIKDNIWVNAGHGHMGWTLSAGSGALMAEMILEGRSDKVVGDFKIEGGP